MLVSFTLQDKSLDTLKGNRERVFLPVSDAYHVFSLSFYLMGPDLCIFFRQKKKLSGLRTFVFQAEHCVNAPLVRTYYLCDKMSVRLV